MPSIYKRKTESAKWTTEAMNRAVAAVKAGTSVRDASVSFNVPKSTLHRYSKSSICRKTWGGTPSLGAEGEEELANYLLKFEGWGLGLTAKEVRLIAFEYCEKNGINHNFDRQRGMAGKDWFGAFMRRHANLALRKAERLSCARAKGKNLICFTACYG